VSHMYVFHRCSSTEIQTFLPTGRAEVWKALVVVPERAC
jgi:hypothetical protein